MTYKATNLSARSWSDIAAHFARIDSPAPALIAIHALCNHIDRAPYRDLVFGATSMHTLLVGQHSELEWQNQMLKIDAPMDDRIGFAFHERDFTTPVAWSCGAHELIATFERFLRRTKWISEFSGSSRGEAPR